MLWVVPQFFDQVWQTRMRYLDMFRCVGALWVGLRAAAGCCTAFLSLCPYLFFHVRKRSESFYVDAPCAH